MNDALRTRSPSPRTGTIIVVASWALAVGAFLAMRHRGQWSAYRALHGWLSESGVPDALRNFDSLLVFAVAAVVGGAIAARMVGGSVSGHLLLQRGRPGWLPMVLVALVPMVVGGAILSIMRGPPPADTASMWPAFIKSVVRAPIMEELLYRGLLIGVVASALGWAGLRFWINALLAAALFASAHVDWTIEGVSRGWPTLLITGLGGLWYAWLLARWRSLWVPMVLHMGMNLGWMLASASGGAGGGGLVENLLRAATILIATWWTLRRTPRSV